MEGEKAMNSKEQILSALRQHTRETYEMPDLAQLNPITYADPVAEFKTKTMTTAGANLMEIQEGDDLNAVIRQIIDKTHPTKETLLIASHLPEVEALLNPDTVDTAQELEPVAIGVVRGEIGVAENACIWIPQTMKERAVCFASQHLVIVLHADAIVNNMHEAYARIEASSEYFQHYKFGTFISGPSKTADIEGALVYGAQAARAVTVVLVNKKC